MVVKLTRELEIEKCFAAEKKDAMPPLATCAECTDTVKVSEARRGPQGYCWCQRCFESVECGDPGCHGHVSHPCEECGRQHK